MATEGTQERDEERDNAEKAILAFLSLFRQVKATFHTIQEMAMHEPRPFSNLEMATDLTSDEVALLRLIKSGDDFHIVGKSPSYVIDEVFGSRTHQSSGTVDVFADHETEYGVTESERSMQDQDTNEQLKEIITELSVINENFDKLIADSEKRKNRLKEIQRLAKESIHDTETYLGTKYSGMKLEP